jgi:GMP synthase-like glutamine amidotransferase
MDDILIFRHARGEGPGYFANFLDKRGIPWRLVRVDEGEPVPDRLGKTPAIVLMGGPMSVNDSLPWIPKVLNLVREAVDADRPVLGHCLGGQLISKALGGVVTRNPVKEIGWLPVSRVGNPAAANWLDGIATTVEVFHWHGETFSIPPGATRILASRDCGNQAFVIGKTLGMQCHVEMLPEMVEEWARTGREEIASCVCPTVQDENAMTVRLEERTAALNKIADRLYMRWISGL